MKKIIVLYIFIIFINNLHANGIWVWDSKEDWERCERLDCDIASNSGSVRILNVISDDFNGPELNARWIWRDEGLSGNTYNFTSNPGCIRLIGSPDAGWWCGQKNGLKLEQSIEKTKSFEAEVCFKNSSLYRHDFGGFEFYVRGEEYTSEYRIRLEAQVPHYLLMVRQDCSNEFLKGFTNQPIYPYYFKITNDYNESNDTNNITFSYRNTTTTAWIEGYTYNNITFDDMYIGLSRSDTVSNQWADVDYFYCSLPVTKRAEITEVTDLGSVPSGQGIIKWIQNLPNLETHPVKFYTQTSDDGVVWSEEWKGPYSDNNGSNILSTNRRYIRYKGILETDDEEYSPELLSVNIEYPTAAPLPPAITSTAIEDGWINTNNATFYFSEAENNGVTVGAYYYTLDSDINTITGANTANNYINITGIAEGMHSLKVLAQADWRNNSLCSNISEYKFNIDKIPPNKPEVKTASHKQYEESGNNNFYAELILEDNKINTVNVSGIAGVSYLLTRNENEEPDNIIDSETGIISINGVDNGTWYFKAKAIDNAGNTSEVLTYCIKINFKGDILAKQNAKIYPNPTRGKFKIWYELAGEAEEVKIMIKDSGGRTFKTIEGGKEAGVNEIEQEISDLANGVYFVKIKVIRKDGREDVVVKKMVVYKK